jgi:hypothetical protein
MDVLAHSEAVMTRYTTPAGARVDVITRRLTGTGGDGQWYRVTGPHGNYAGETRTTDGLAGLGIDLAELELAA